jgi:hypothetical protein
MVKLWKIVLHHSKRQRHPPADTNSTTIVISGMIIRFICFKGFFYLDNKNKGGDVRRGITGIRYRGKLHEQNKSILFHAHPQHTIYV